MIFAVVLGLVAVFAVVQLLRWYAETDVNTIKRTASWIGIGALALVVLFLAVTDRFGAALALFAGLIAWAMRIMHVINMGRQFGIFRRWRFGGSAGSTQSSAVDSRYLSMRLDHASGAIDGEVREGTFAGRRLRDMTKADLLLLLEEVRVDIDSASLLEAYLDRVHPGWRGADDTQRAETARTTSSTMTVEEAYRVLGLDKGANDAAVRAAYRRLMAQFHPDHGGTDYLAAKVNQAKDVLLKR